MQAPINYEMMKSGPSPGSRGPRRQRPRRGPRYGPGRRPYFRGGPTRLWGRRDRVINRYPVNYIYVTEDDQGSILENQQLWLVLFLVLFGLVIFGVSRRR